MSVNDSDQGAPIVRGSPLARTLDDYAVPGLAPGFAERVLAAAEARPAPLPDLRRPGRGRGWRWGRGIAIGVVSFGALASAAAATGLLQQLDIPVPSAERVWASITGQPAAVAAAPAPAIAAASPVAGDPAIFAPVEITGPIDTPEELGEAFRRIDEVREGRLAARRAQIDQRIDTAIERRSAAGLPRPTAEEEAALRARLADAQARREQLADERLAARRAEMERRVESGEPLTRDDIIRPLREDARALQRDQRIERLQRMAPEQRRAALRRLPPAERRALIEEYRNRRAGQASPVPEPVPEPAADPETPADPAG